jgi:hypothetical protein
LGAYHDVSFLRLASREPYISVGLEPLSKLQVRLRSPWTERLETKSAVFIRDLPVERADALLCEWEPQQELFTFPRRRAWYCCEPACQFKSIQNGSWIRIRDRLKPPEFLWHGHPNPTYRIPHQTHFETPHINDNKSRSKRAVAIVSNYGGNSWFRHPDLAYRNRLITSQNVDLFGRETWQSYRQSWLSPARCPSNYKGELTGDWPSSQKRELMGRYKVCVCLENMNEPGYFTEKFVEAVIAGCIPVYRASADIKETVLQGASWFDPADPRWPAEKAIEAALDADFEEHFEKNFQWLKNSLFLKQTSVDSIFENIAMALSNS